MNEPRTSTVGVLRSLLTAPYDDEPYTDEQRARVDEARRGPSIPWDEAMRLIEK